MEPREALIQALNAWSLTHNDFYEILNKDSFPTEKLQTVKNYLQNRTGAKGARKNCPSIKTFDEAIKLLPLKVGYLYEYLKRHGLPNIFCSMPNNFATLNITLIISESAVRCTCFDINKKKNLATNIVMKYAKNPNLARAYSLIQHYPDRIKNIVKNIILTKYTEIFDVTFEDVKYITEPEVPSTKMSSASAELIEAVRRLIDFQKSKSRHVL